MSSLTSCWQNCEPSSCHYFLRAQLRALAPAESLAHIEEAFQVLGGGYAQAGNYAAYGLVVLGKANSVALSLGLAQRIAGNMLGAFNVPSDKVRGFSLRQIGKQQQNGYPILLQTRGLVKRIHIAWVRRPYL